MPNPASHSPSQSCRPGKMLMMEHDCVGVYIIFIWSIYNIYIYIAFVFVCVCIWHIYGVYMYLYMYIHIYIYGMACRQGT